MLTMTISEWLKSERYVVDIVHTGELALEHLQSFEYDLVILDWEMPALSGIEVTKQYRDSGGMTPILLLTGKDTIDEKEMGFDAGADDYLTKPFHPKELSARLRALLRRPNQILGETLKVRNIVLDPGTRIVTKAGKVVPLQPLEFSVLEFFLRHPTDVVGPEGLLRRVWDSDTNVSQDAIYTCIKRIRKKLDDDGQPSILKTVHGIGYKLES